MDVLTHFSCPCQCGTRLLLPPAFLALHPCYRIHRRPHDAPHSMLERYIKALVMPAYLRWLMGYVPAAEPRTDREDARFTAGRVNGPRNPGMKASLDLQIAGTMTDTEHFSRLYSAGNFKGSPTDSYVQWCIYVLEQPTIENQHVIQQRRARRSARKYRVFVVCASIRAA
ncbi:hypothetical protein H4582DRAFT_735779 [Lactarius indigo]|nr:hypothetical protein H4582DRAFT_735779 [Lactarius indigo]